MFGTNSADNFDSFVTFVHVYVPSKSLGVTVAVIICASDTETQLSAFVVDNETTGTGFTTIEAEAWPLQPAASVTSTSNVYVSTAAVLRNVGFAIVVELNLLAADPDHT